MGSNGNDRRQKGTLDPSCLGMTANDYDNKDTAQAEAWTPNKDPAPFDKLGTKPFGSLYSLRANRLKPGLQTQGETDPI
jgi:hypothetical protein